MSKIKDFLIEKENKKNEEIDFQYQEKKYRGRIYDSYENTRQLDREHDIRVTNPRDF